MNPDNVARATATNAKTYNAKASQAESVNAEAATYAAYKKAVENNDLTSHHLKKLLDENSDYVKRGKTEGKQYAQSRGILNTTMGAAAAHGAAIDRAMPIASQDASTYNQRALTHIGEENTARRTNATNKTNVSITNASNATNVNMSNADARTKVSMSNADGRNKASIANANNQTNTSQFNTGQENSFWQQYINNDNEAKKYNTASENDASKFNAGSENDASRFTATAENNASIVNSGADNDVAKQAITESNANYRHDSDILATDRRFDAELDFKGEQADADRELSKYNIDSSAKADLTNVYVQGLTQINNNPDLTMDAKKAATTNLINGIRTAAVLSEELDAFANGDISTSQMMQSNASATSSTVSGIEAEARQALNEISSVEDFKAWDDRYGNYQF